MSRLPSCGPVASTAGVLLFTLAACQQDSTFEVDARPIALLRAPLRADEAPGGGGLGAVLARARLGGGEISTVVVDTSSILSGYRTRPCGEGPGWLYRADLSLIDAVHPAQPVRALFRDVDLFDFCVGPVGSEAVRPAGIVGVSLLGFFSVEFVLPAELGEPPTVSFRHGLPGTDGAWEVSGYSVLRFGLGRTVTVTTPDRKDTTDVGLNTVVMGACLAPDAFAENEVPPRCARGAAVSAGRGVDLNLALGTGVGPLVLSESAWARVAPTFGARPEDGVAGPLYLSLSETAISARWTSIPRLALVNDVATDLGPCAELARSRRLQSAHVRAAGPVPPVEQDARRAAAEGAIGACIDDCDSEGQALATAAYLELAGEFPVAVVADSSRVILDLNPNLPFDSYVDGIIGTAALAGTRFEVDYLARPQARVVARCEPGVARASCSNVGRCDRTPSTTGRTTCFGREVVLPRCRDLPVP